MKYITLYTFLNRIIIPTITGIINADSVEDVISIFKNKVGISSHLAIFDDKRKRVYEGDIEIPRRLKPWQQKYENDSKTLPKRIEKVKSILKECGISIKMKVYDYDSHTITFEYKGEKILDEDECRIDMESTAFNNWCKKVESLCKR